MNSKARLYRYTRLHNPPKYLVVVFRKITPETHVFDEAITNQMIEKNDLWQNISWKICEGNSQ